MMSLKRSLLTVAACAAALTALATGCGTASSNAANVAAAPSHVATHAAAPSQGPVVYLAEGGSVGGTVVHAPACRTGCPLSGDGTTSLWDMTWQTWNSTVAAGTGTEKLDDCTPDCATGTLYPVRVAVTLSKPVMVCTSGAARWFWTRVSFAWPDGLPATFSGANAPLNPFGYRGITAQPTKPRDAKACP
jgi:hypothetical protein